MAAHACCSAECAEAWAAAQGHFSSQGCRPELGITNMASSHCLILAWQSVSASWNQALQSQDRQQSRLQGPDSGTEADLELPGSACMASEGGSSSAPLWHRALCCRGLDQQAAVMWLNRVCY